MFSNIAKQWIGGNAFGENDRIANWKAFDWIGTFVLLCPFWKVLQARPQMTLIWLAGGVKISKFWSGKLFTNIFLHLSGEGQKHINHNLHINYKFKLNVLKKLLRKLRKKRRKNGNDVKNPNKNFPFKKSKFSFNLNEKWIFLIKSDWNVSRTSSWNHQDILNKII